MSQKQSKIQEEKKLVTKLLTAVNKIHSESRIGSANMITFTEPIFRYRILKIKDWLLQKNYPPIAICEPIPWGYSEKREIVVGESKISKGLAEYLGKTLDEQIAKGTFKPDRNER